MKGSHESLSESTDSGAAMSEKSKPKSKSPSPNRTEIHNNLIDKKSNKILEKQSNVKKEDISSTKQESFELPKLDEESQDQSLFQKVPKRIIKRNNENENKTKRDDSIESNVPSAKNSIQYSDTSSLLSHR